MSPDILKSTFVPTSHAQVTLLQYKHVYLSSIWETVSKRGAKTYNEI